MTDIISFEPVVARDANGDPVALARAEFFASGTTTPVTVYADQGETTPHPSPLLADGNGVFPAVFRSGGAVKAVVKTPLGATLYTLDPVIKVAASASAASAISFAASAAIPATNVQAAVEKVQANVEANGTAIALKANIASPELTGNPTAPTQAVGNNSTRLANTAFVNAQTLNDDLATPSTTRPPSATSVINYVGAQAKLQFATQVATTAGTAFDFEDFPATITEIVVMFDGVSLSGTDHILVQLGTPGGIGASGYDSASRSADIAGISSTAGMIVYCSGASEGITGIMHLLRMDSDKWVSSHAAQNDGAAGLGVSAGGGASQAFAQAVTRVRVTRTGTNTFDAGAIRVGYR